MFRRFIRHTFLQTRIQYINPKGEIKKGYLVTYVVTGLTKGQIGKNSQVKPQPILTAIIEVKNNESKWVHQTIEPGLIQIL